jgi:hypothetical protein
VAPNNNEVSPEGFFPLAFSRQVVPRAAKVAFLVGTVLAIINHGDKILTMSLSDLELIKIMFTYLVPYGVSTWSAVRAIQANASNGT